MAAVISARKLVCFHPGTPPEATGLKFRPVQITSPHGDSGVWVVGPHTTAVLKKINTCLIILSVGGPEECAGGIWHSNQGLAKPLLVGCLGNPTMTQRATWHCRKHVQHRVLVAYVLEKGAINITVEKAIRGTTKLTTFALHFACMKKGILCVLCAIEGAPQ